MNYARRREIYKIEWMKEASISNVTQEEGEKLLSWYQENGEEALSKCNRVDWLDEGVFKVDYHGFWKKLYCREKGKLKVYAWHTIDDDRNTGEIEHPGQVATNTVELLFKKWNDGKTLYGAFGYSEAEEIKKCVPGELYYIDDLSRNINIANVCKCDYSSHYPGALCGRLPSFREEDIIRVKGRVEPDDEYPFAFYVESGHLCEKGVFDTRKWKNHYFGRLLYKKREGPNRKKVDRYKTIPDEEEKTILCKASKYTLTREMEYFYSKKEVSEKAKLVMNTFIGYCHPNNERRSAYRLFHIAAVCIGRASQKMLDLADEIGFKNILMIINDSIIYHGDMEFPEEKKLGEPRQEIYRWHFRMKGINQYAFADPETRKVCYLEKPYVNHSGFDEGITDTVYLEDIDRWRQREETKQKSREGKKAAADLINKTFEGGRRE